MPVNFVLDGGAVVLRTARGGGLAAVARAERQLCFEVDNVEPALHVGWSVMVSDRVEIVGDAEETRRLEALAGAPWVAIAEPVFVRLALAQISGRRLPLHPGGVTVEPVEET